MALQLLRRTGVDPVPVRTIPIPDTAALTAMLAGTYLSYGALTAGDCLELVPEAVYTGPFTLPAVSGASASAPVWLRPASYTTNFTRGTRAIVADTAAMPLLTNTTLGTTIWEMEAAARSWRFWGLRFRHGETAHNCSIATYPRTGFDDATYARAHQADDLEFRHCLWDYDSGTPFVFSTTSHIVVRHEGKALTFRDCTATGIVGGVSGQGDGYFVSGSVGEGPIVFENCLVESSGEALGYGMHGFSGDGQDGLDYVPPYPLFWQNDVQPNVGMTITKTKITRNPAWQGDTDIGQKNLFEMTYGTDLLMQGCVLSNYWDQNGQQYHALCLKQSCQRATRLDYIQTARITFDYCVFHSLAQLLQIARYTAAPATPQITDIVLRHCLIFDVDNDTYGVADDKPVCSLGWPVANIQIEHCTFDISAMSYFVSSGSGGISYDGTNPVTNLFAGFVLRDTVLLFPGDHGMEFFGYAGDGTTLGLTAAAWFANVCSSPTVSHNLVVRSSSEAGYINWTGYTTSSFMYDGTAGRTTALSKFRDPANGTLAARDYRFLANQEANFQAHDSGTIGPDFTAMRAAMGAAWPFSWTP